MIFLQIMREKRIWSLRIASYMKLGINKSRKFLQDFFRPHNEKLFKMIGRRFDWND
jgi:hypothetical protein